MSRFLCSTHFFGVLQEECVFLGYCNKNVLWGPNDKICFVCLPQQELLTYICVTLRKEQGEI